MKSQELQNLIKELFSDEKTRHDFESNPEGILSRFHLTDEEKRAVLNTNARFGLITSDSPQLEAALSPTIDWASPNP